MRRFKEQALRSKKGKKPSHFTASGSLVAPTDMTKLSGGRFQISVLAWWRDFSWRKAKSITAALCTTLKTRPPPITPLTGNLQKVSQSVPLKKTHKKGQHLLFWPKRKKTPWFQKNHNFHQCARPETEKHILSYLYVFHIYIHQFQQQIFVKGVHALVFFLDP